MVRYHVRPKMNGISVAVSLSQKDQSSSSPNADPNEDPKTPADEENRVDTSDSAMPSFAQSVSLTEAAP
jgi:hypothetical protein